MGAKNGPKPWKNRENCTDSSVSRRLLKIARQFMPGAASKHYKFRRDG